VAALQLTGTMAALYLPAIDAEIVDRGVARGDTATIVRLGTMMLAVGALQLTCSVVAVRLGSRLGLEFGRDLRLALFDRVTAMSMDEVAGFGRASLLTRSTTDVQTVEGVVQQYSTTMVASVVTGIGGVAMAARQDLGLSWVLLAAVPLLAVATTLIMSRLISHERQMQNLFDRMNQIVREQLSGVRAIRAFTREAFERDRFAGVSATFSRSALAADRWQALLQPVLALILSLSGVALVWFGGLRIDAGQMRVGQLIALMLYAMQILTAASMASKILANAPAAAASVDRIDEVLATGQAVAPPAANLPDGQGVIEFHEVTFGYAGDDRPALHDVSFRTSPGRVTAIVGATGSGKSTIISLLSRLYEATAGSVTVDGVDVRECGVDEWCSRIAVVPQQGYLFSGTVADNLRFGKPDASKEEMWAALRIAAADGFVAAHPDGLRMPVARGGVNLSGGQRQRLAIARAVLRRPAVYLFDDAFSALDVSTQRDVWAALREHCSDAAVVVVSQRTSAAVEADEVIVLDDGSVVAVGDHKSLLDECPLYAELAGPLAAVVA
jgi:ATP-binding cassette subfamily B protein